MSALQYTTVVSDDPSIDYQPSQGVWNAVGDSGSTRGTFKLSRAQEGIAVITRTFRSAHFVSPLWPFPILVQISIDGVAQVIDLQDHTVPARQLPPTGLDRATKPSQTQWSFHGVDKERTVTISAAESDNGYIAVVDSLIFEVAEPGDAPAATVLSPVPSPVSDINHSSQTITRDPASTIQSPPSPSETSAAHSPSSYHKSGTNDQKLLILISSICAPAVLIILGGFVSLLLIRGRGTIHPVKKIDTKTWKSNDGLHGDHERGQVEKIPTGWTKGLMGRVEQEETTTSPRSNTPRTIHTFEALKSCPPRRATKVHIPRTASNTEEDFKTASLTIDVETSNTVLQSAQTYALSDSLGTFIIPEAFVKSYVRRHITPTTPDSMSIYTSGSMLSDGVDHAMLALGVWQEAGVGYGYGAGMSTVRSTANLRSKTWDSALYPSSPLPLGSSVCIFRESLTLSPVKAIHTTGKIHTKDSFAESVSNGVPDTPVSSRSTNNVNKRSSSRSIPIRIHSASARSIKRSKKTMDSIMVPPSRMPTMDTSDIITPSSPSEYSSTQWHEFIARFPIRPGSSIQTPVSRYGSESVLEMT